MLRKRQNHWFQRLASAGALVSLIYVAGASGGGRPGGSTSGASPLFFTTSGESVGTLPNESGSPCSPWCYRPSLFVVATRDGIERALLSHEGSLLGVGVTLLDDGRHHFVFYGPSFEVQLDRSMIASGEIEVAVQIGYAFQGGAFAHETSGLFSGFRPLPASVTFDPNYQGQLTSTLFAVPPLTTHFVSQRGALSQIEMSAIGNIATFEQRHLRVGQGL